MKRGQGDRRMLILIRSMYTRERKKVYASHPNAKVNRSDTTPFHQSTKEEVLYNRCLLFGVLFARALFGKSTLHIGTPTTIRNPESLINPREKESIHHYNLKRKVEDVKACPALEGVRIRRRSCRHKIACRPESRSQT